MLAVVLAAVLAGCTGGGSGPRAAASTEPPSTAVSSSTSPVPPVSGGIGPATALTPPGPTASDGTPSGSPAGPSVAPSAASTADRSAAPPASAVTITAVEVRTDAATEQIIISSQGGVPGWSVRYVDAVRIDGEPVLTAGAVAMEIVLQAADPTGEQGLSDAVAGDIVPGQDLVQEVLLAQHLADTVVFAVGLSRQVPFSVISTGTSITVTLDP